jgi:hypothetical protein
LAGILRRLPKNFSRETPLKFWSKSFPPTATGRPNARPLFANRWRNFLTTRRFCIRSAPVKDGRDPLAEDWDWVRGHMTALAAADPKFCRAVRRAQTRRRRSGFSRSGAVRVEAALGFCREPADAAAERWRAKIRFVFVDEYQDINAAQDKIIQALSRDSSPSPAFSRETPGEPPKMGSDPGRGRPPHPATVFSSAT